MSDNIVLHCIVEMGFLMAYVKMDGVPRVIKYCSQWEWKPWYWCSCGLFGTTNRVVEFLTLLMQLWAFLTLLTQYLNFTESHSLDTDVVSHLRNLDQSLRIYSLGFIEENSYTVGHHNLYSTFVAIIFVTTMRWMIKNGDADTDLWLNS